MKSIDKDQAGQSRSAMSHATILLPDGFDPRDEDCLPAGKWKYADQARLIIHWIAIKAAMRPDRDGWVAVRHEDATRLFGGNNRLWDWMRQEFLDRGVIECNHKYKRGEYAMEYRLLPPWRDADLVEVTLRNPELAVRLLKAQSDNSRRDSWEPVHYGLEHRLGQVRVDEQAARRLICRQFSEKQRRTRQIVNIIQAGHPRMSVGTTGRVFSPVTQPSKQLRPCLTVNGQRLFEQDVSSSQPLLLGLLCMQPSQPGNICGIGSRGSSLYMSCNSAPICTHAGNPSDLKDHVSACERGEFYEELAEALRIPCSSRRERNAVKRAWCRMTYGRTREHASNWKAYSNRYPTVAAMTENIKKGNHKNAARILQTMESSIMIHEVTHDMIMNDENHCVLTIHDGIMSHERLADHVRNTIIQKWGNHGAKPRINLAYACVWVVRRDRWIKVVSGNDV
jgi:hypothetical protein